MNNKRKNITRILRPIRSKTGLIQVSQKIACKSCCLTFPTKYAVSVHRNRVHLPPDHRFHCNQCSAKFHTKHNWSRHKKLHDDHICTFCNTGFSSEAHLNEHHLEAHPDSLYRRFKCVKCLKLYGTRNMLLRHCRKMHSVASVQFRCGVCGFRDFDQRTELKEHIRMCRFDESNRSTKDETIEFELSNDDNMPAEFLNYNLLSDDDYFDADELLMGHDSSHPSMVEEFLEDAFQIPSYDDSILDILMEDIGSGCAIKTVTSKLNGCYECPRCKSQKFNSQLQLNVHLAHDHMESVLICNECGASFNALSDFKTHQNEHKNESRLANKSLSMFFGATSHENVHGHSFRTTNLDGCTMFRCKHCQQIFKTISETQKHECPSGDQSNTSKHSQQSYESQATCNTPLEICEPDKIQIADTLCCSLCDKKFKTIAGLKYHLKTHTAVKSFRCPFCDRTFLANINLHAHIRVVHSTHKTHVCQECDRRFVKEYDLRRHIAVTHQKKRNFVCSTCDKRFAQQSHLTQHSWQHTGVKPFPCDRCAAAYTSQTALKKHVKSVHKDVPTDGITLTKICIE